MNKDTIRLTPKMDDVIRKMREGWGMAKSLHFMTSSSAKTRYWIQDGGIGKGGKSQNIREQTFNAMIRLSLIEQHENQNWGLVRTEFQLTEKGKSIKL